MTTRVVFLLFVSLREKKNCFVLFSFLSARPAKLSTTDGRVSIFQRGTLLLTEHSLISEIPSLIHRVIHVTHFSFDSYGTSQRAL